MTSQKCPIHSGTCAKSIGVCQGGRESAHLSHHECKTRSHIETQLNSTVELGLCQFLYVTGD